MPPSSGGAISVEQQALTALASSLSAVATDLTPVAATLSKWDAGATSMKSPAAAAAFDRLKTVWTKELSDQGRSLESLAGAVGSASVSYGTNDSSVAGALAQVLTGGLSRAGNPAAPAGPPKN